MYFFYKTIIILKIKNDMAMTLAKLLNRTLLISKIIFSNTVFSFKTKNVGYLKPCMPNLKKMDHKTLQEKRIKVGTPNPISVYYSVCPSLIKNNRVIIAWRIHKVKHDFLSGNR